MTDIYKPPTEFIEGLGIDFRKPPQPAFYYDEQMRHQLSRALGYIAHVPGSERVHIPGTPRFSRHELSLYRDDNIVEKLALAEGEDSHGFSAIVGLAVGETEETIKFRSLFAVETTLGDSLAWSPLKYRDIHEAELTDPQDLDAAQAILQAATKKPDKRMRKAVTSYFVNGRKPWFNRLIGAPDDDISAENILKG